MNKQLLVVLALTIATMYGVSEYNQIDSSSSFLSNEISQIQQEFNDFMIKCDKSYSTEERINRFNVFSQNWIAVNVHNTQSEESYEMEINCFADLNQIEFNLRRNQYQVKENNNVQVLETINTPAAVDWTTSNAVVSVKNQGQCGSCWAFSTICATEGLHAISTGTLKSFSEQQLVDCSASYGNNGCQGGLMDYGFKYIQDNGITTESSYPYTGKVGTCQSFTSAFKINSFVDVEQKSQSQLMAAIALQPVSIAIDASSLGFQLYKKGVFTGKGFFKGCKTNLDHGVTVVGYGSDKGSPFYLVRNSWGPSWGMGGYIELANSGDGAGTCGIQLSASRPTL